MKKFRVVVTETQSYEMYVEADDKDEAKEIALEEYGSIGDIFSTFSEVELVQDM